MAGRDISVTKMAFGSTRVMGTCAVGGQAAGTAAALAVRRGVLPGDMAGHMEELQQTLLRDDCYLPGFANRDPSSSPPRPPGGPRRSPPSPAPGPPSRRLR